VYVVGPNATTPITAILQFHFILGEAELNVPLLLVSAQLAHPVISKDRSAAASGTATRSATARRTRRFSY